MFKSVEVTANTTPAMAALPVKHLVHLTVDGSNAVQFNFDAAVGAPGTFTLKSGESITNIPINVSNLHYQAVTATSEIRALGLPQKV